MAAGQEGGHDVFRVVALVQGGIRQVQQGLVSLHDLRFPVIKVRRRIFRTEGANGYVQVRKPLFGAYHGQVVFRLVVENVQLGVVVILHGLVAVHVVRRKIEPYGHVRVEIADGFQLEGADLQRQHVRHGVPEQDFRHRDAVIAAGDGRLSGAKQDFSTRDVVVVFPLVPVMAMMRPW